MIGGIIVGGLIILLGWMIVGIEIFRTPPICPECGDNLRVRKKDKKFFCTLHKIIILPEKFTRKGWEATYAHLFDEEIILLKKNKVPIDIIEDYSVSYKKLLKFIREKEKEKTK